MKLGDEVVELATATTTTTAGLPGGRDLESNSEKNRHRRVKEGFGWVWLDLDSPALNTKAAPADLLLRGLKVNRLSL